MSRHEDTNAQPADLSAHLEDSEYEAEFLAGDAEAKVEAEKMGMKPACSASWWGFD